MEGLNENGLEELNIADFIRGAGEVLSGFNPELAQTFLEAMEGEGDQDEILGFMLTLCEQYGVDVDAVLSALQERDLIEAQETGMSAFDEPVAEASKEAEKARQRAPIVEACRGILPDRECADLMTCGFPEGVTIWEVVVNMLTRIFFNQIEGAAGSTGKKKKAFMEQAKAKAVAHLQAAGLNPEMFPPSTGME